MINGHAAPHKRTQGLFISVHRMNVVLNAAMLDVTVKNHFFVKLDFQPKGGFFVCILSLIIFEHILCV